MLGNSVTIHSLDFLLLNFPETWNVYEKKEEFNNVAYNEMIHIKKR